MNNSNEAFQATLVKPASSLETISLSDKYTLKRGRAFMTGTQAFIRLAMLQHQCDVIKYSGLYHRLSRLSNGGCRYDSRKSEKISGS